MYMLNFLPSKLKKSEKNSKNENVVTKELQRKSSKKRSNLKQELAPLCHLKMYQNMRKKYSFSRYMYMQNKG